MTEEKKNPFNLKMAIIYTLFMKELLEENQKLKKQLEDMTLCRDIASSHREEVQNREIALLNQQKDFIKYLEDEIKLEIQRENINCEATNKKIFLEEVLQKYKEVIGSDK
mgnify:CR=1 FL=1